MRRVNYLIVCLLPGWLGMASWAQERTSLEKIEESLRDDIPKLLCLDRSFATGGQPSERAFAVLAANGFRSVLNLRTEQESNALPNEKESVEKAGLRYLHLPIVSSNPQPDQADKFRKLVKDPANHPMLIHCASANRVGAFWAIHRVADHGWSEEKALQEAARIGLTSPLLKRFVHEYLEHTPSKSREP
ncbi:MAG: protein tyrosine phosphatase family protein [Acidobacteriota bacterium]